MQCPLSGINHCQSTPIDQTYPLIPLTDLWVHAAKFFWFYLFELLTLAYYSYYGIMCVALTSTLQLASVISTTAYAMWVLFAGFLFPRPVRHALMSGCASGVLRSVCMPAAHRQGVHAAMYLSTCFLEFERLFQCHSKTGMQYEAIVPARFDAYDVFMPQLHWLHTFCMG